MNSIPIIGSQQHGRLDATDGLTQRACADGNGGAALQHVDRGYIADALTRAGCESQYIRRSAAHVAYAMMTGYSLAQAVDGERNSRPEWFTAPRLRIADAQNDDGAGLAAGQRDRRVSGRACQTQPAPAAVPITLGGQGRELPPAHCIDVCRVLGWIIIGGLFWLAIFWIAGWIGGRP